jgi:hypothetical protein
MAFRAHRRIQHEQDSQIFVMVDQMAEVPCHPARTIQTGVFSPQRVDGAESQHRMKMIERCFSILILDAGIGTGIEQGTESLGTNSRRRVKQGRMSLCISCVDRRSGIDQPANASVKARTDRVMQRRHAIGIARRSVCACRQQGQHVLVHVFLAGVVQWRPAHRIGGIDRGTLCKELCQLLSTLKRRVVQGCASGRRHARFPMDSPFCLKVRASFRSRFPSAG